MDDSSVKKALSHPSYGLKEDREKLKGWAQIEGSPVIHIFGIGFYNLFSKVAQRDLQLGTLVKISLMIQNLESDSDRDGDLSQEEKKEFEERDKEMIDQFVNCVGTCGVIGALVFSGLCGTVLNPVTPSDDSIEFFGHSALLGMSYAYYALMYSAFLISCYVVVISFVIFLAVTIWMPNRDLRSWYIRKASAIVRLLLASAATIIVTFLSVLIGVAINIGPIPAVIAFLAVAITLAVGVGEYAHMSGVSCEALHIYCREKLFADELKNELHEHKQIVQKKSIVADAKNPSKVFPTDGEN